jgi:hypothetical protein
MHFGANCGKSGKRGREALSNEAKCLPCTKALSGAEDAEKRKEGRAMQAGSKLSLWPLDRASCDELSILRCNQNTMVFQRFNAYCIIYK